jgi:phenol 2-monooxygenase
MQYHLNGFKPGNLQISDDARLPPTVPPIRDLPAEVDVLIVGCGPAGLTLARQLADFASITTCIVDQKSGPMLFGQADGISCRTQEIMEAFNCSEILAKEMYHLHRNAFWEPDSTNPSHIKRTHKVNDARLGLSEFTHGVVNQSRLHDLLLDGMANSVTHLIPDYNRQLVELNVDQSLSQDLAAHPITARFMRTDNDDEETIKARYVVGCDGGRSSVRHELGINMEGDSANKAWGVMDVLVTTDFPDIRVKSFIQSKHHGAVMVVPREGGYLVRLYVELDLLAKDQRAANLDLGVEDIIQQAQMILAPYQLDVKEVAWWSIYEVGQRVAEKFDDTAQDSNDKVIPRAFIAGDAGHTHSPKGGWGLNTSLPDTFNLGWKLAAVLQGQAQPKLLRTYAEERRKVAHMLINADREMSALVATKPKAGAEQNKDGTLAIEKFIARQNGFIAGTSIGYDESYICTGFEHQHLATGFPIGQRFHSVVAERLVDGCPTHLGHLNKADGRWRLFIFADNQSPIEPTSKFNQLTAFLSESEKSPINKYSKPMADLDAIIDICAVIQADVEIGDLPELVRPSKGKYGLRDYEKVYVSTTDNDVYQQRGINKDQGAIVLVRPDQHVATVLPLYQVDQLAEFYANIMIEPTMDISNGFNCRLPICPLYPSYTNSQN